MNTPFWVLEDGRCETWSPTPQYLHKDARFYSTPPFNWNPHGSGHNLQTPDIYSAMQFATKAAAKGFARTYGPDVKLTDWMAREHVFCAINDAPPPVSLGLAVTEGDSSRDAISLPTGTGEGEALAFGTPVTITSPEHDADWGRIPLFMAGVTADQTSGEANYWLSETWPPACLGDITDGWRREHFRASPSSTRSVT